ncbi:hypothetical protein [Bradyrhizobium sp. AUGA SZCCT0042]|uniref:hypothetical protein n=1 Tax=Bradyrhizobium sp. AUGA SZCCT0042 TaxID=2807651 RepID=UPI001BA8B65F|nr:hypothetical protein [Bradyrhizobium sp. AUGA SZCCT0042]MBR1302472.1 hypothetical protein [Bradyrhizobium sp. AUGA SZCCT0042]
MNRRSKARFSRCIRLIDRVNSIGVPVFTLPNSNAMLIPETDGDLKIARFLDFYNEASYPIKSDLPLSERNRWYSIGDAGPIPAWFDDECLVLPSGASIDDAREMLRDKPAADGVKGDLLKLIRDARRGVFWERQKQWQADDIAARFGDVLFAAPSHARYWVSRYRVAVRNVRALTQPPHPIDAKLKATALEWLRSFGSKTDPKRLASMIGNSAEGIFSDREQQTIWFSYLSNKVNAGNVNEIYEEWRSGVSRMFPRGLYGYYIEHGWPEAPFPIIRSADFRQLMIDKLYSAERTGGFESCYRLAQVLFNNADAPNEVSESAAQFLRDRIRRFHEDVDDAYEVFRQRHNSHRWRGVAQGLLMDYTSIQHLDAVLHADARDLVVVGTRHGVQTMFSRL